MCGHHWCGQKAEGRGAKMPVDVPRWAQPDTEAPSEGAEPVWGVHGQHQAAAQGTGLWVSLSNHIWEAGKDL